MVKQALKRTTTIFQKSQNTIISAAIILAVASGANALLGFAKNRLLTYFFGVSNQLSVFYTADRIPNLIYSVLVVGALSTVFIPIFTNILKKDTETAFKTASTIINIGVIFFLIMGGAVFVFSRQIMILLSFGKFPEADIVIGSNLIRIMICAQLILVVSSFITSILQSYQFFLIPAVSSLVYNIGIILGTVFLSSKYGIYGPTYGVVIGALFHLIVQIPLLKKTGFTYSVMVDISNKGIQELFGLIPPRILSVLITSVIYTVNNSLAILVSTGSVVILKFASQLQFFPVSFFGLSIASAALPTLSSESSSEDKSHFKKTFITSLHQMLFLVIPASIVLLVLRIPIVRIVYGVPTFPWEATLATAQTLAFFSISIFAQSTIYLLTRAFYAMHDTLTPVKVSVITIFINILASLFFVKFMGWGVWSIALSFSLTAFLDMTVMFYLFFIKVKGFTFKEIFNPFSKIALAGAFMGISLYLPMKYLDKYVLDTTHTFNLLILTAAASIAGCFSYLIFTKIFGVEEIKLFYKLLRKFNISIKYMSKLNVESDGKIAT